MHVMTLSRKSTYNHCTSNKFSHFTVSFHEKCKKSNVSYLQVSNPQQIYEISAGKSKNYHTVKYKKDWLNAQGMSRIN